MIKRVEISEIPGACHKPYSALQAELEEFAKSDWPACEVVTTNYKSPNAARGAYLMAVKRSHRAITVLRRGDRVFLIKEAAK